MGHRHDAVMSAWSRLWVVCLVGLASLVTGGQAGAAVIDNHIALVSVADPEVVGANGSIAQDVSADGRFVVFTSQQPNLVPGQSADGGLYVYLRDLTTGATRRVSPAGSVGYTTGNVSISADGRYIAYGAQSSADSVGRLYRYDATTGVNTVISKAKSSAETSTVWFKSDISATGRYVVYVRSSSTDDVTFVKRLFRYDAATGTTQRLVAGDVGGTRDRPNYYSTPSVSADGRYVAFVRAVDPTLDQPTFRLLLLDTSTGSARTIATSSPQYNIDNAFSGPSISDDGRYVAYGDEGLNVRLFDASAGTSSLVSRTSTGAPGNGASTMPAISSTGRFVTYTSSATDIAPGPLGAATVLLLDRTTGTTQAIVRNRQGVYSDNAGATSSFSHVSTDGRTVAFTSTVRGLTAGTSTTMERVFAWRG
jgi:hypothetical protein